MSTGMHALSVAQRTVNGPPQLLGIGRSNVGNTAQGMARAGSRDALGRSDPRSDLISRGFAPQSRSNSMADLHSLGQSQAEQGCGPSAQTLGESRGAPLASETMRPPATLSGAEVNATDLGERHLPRATASTPALPDSPLLTPVASTAASSSKSRRPPQVPLLDLTSIHRNAGHRGEAEVLNTSVWNNVERSSASQASMPIDAARVTRRLGFAFASSEDQQRIAEFYGYRDEGFVATMHGLRTDEIRARLYLGNMADAAYWPLLKALSITHVLNCAVEAQKTKPPYESHGISYMLLPLYDSPDQAQSLTKHRFRTLREATRFINTTIKGSKKHSILLHCVQGLSRSAAIACAYLMEYESLPLDRALNEVRTKHNGCLTSHHWQAMLYKFNAELLRGS